MKDVPKALTIAGSDSGGGAGIQADLKTFTALKTYGLSVITSLTAQNTLGVASIYNLPLDFIEAQFDKVMEDIGCDACKIGMLSNSETILLIAKKIKQYGLNNLILDPVMIAKGGAKLLEDDAVDTLKSELLPLSLLVTPNIPEAEALSGLEIRKINDMKEASKEIIKMGCKNVLIKGGHMESTESIDIFYNGEEFTEFSAERINTKNTHGTGCTYSAAICANIANGLQIIKSIEKAKNFITNSIKQSLNIGTGHGPLNHFWDL